MNLTKAHVRYLESELVKLAKKIGRVALLNGNAPTGGAALPEADQSDMQYFISQIRILMPVLGFDIFRGRSGLAKPISPVTEGGEGTSQAVASTQNIDDIDASESPESPVFHMSVRHGIDAHAQIIDGEFTLLEGSLIPAAMKDSPNMSAATRRQFVMRQALHTKVLEVSAPGPNPEVVRLTKDFVFSSPSAAGAIVYGRPSANGRTTWKTDSGQTLGEWEQGGLANS